MEKVVIIGGGIIGLSSAYYLLKEGYDVTLIDKKDFKDGASQVNAGLIVPSHIVPLSAPGMIEKGIKWMFDSSSPFYLKPRLNLPLMKWGYRFYRSATKEHVSKCVPILRDFNVFSKELYQSLASELEFQLHGKGLLMLYRDAETEKEEIETAHLANKSGVKAEILSAQEVHNLQGGLIEDIRGGVYFPGDAHLNPSQVIQSLYQAILKLGGRVVSKETVQKIEWDSKGIRRVEGKSGAFYKADKFLFATGNWLPELTKQLGFSPLMQAGKGYSITKNQMEDKLQIPCILADESVAMTPIGDQMRVAGTMEINGANERISKKRVQGICSAVEKYFPNYKMELPSSENIQWGFRPCTPDGLPYLGKLKSHQNVFISAGHAMMGMSLGPASGKLLAELISGKELSLSIDAFNPNRFD
ncbi:NAD(P)/FAD-dependent oxidoreductase [Sediminitomix flava]|uniref:D-amino-acid dehydrogenase n=1 Tax=Sediminitomix flava TaxID=379075 RepID=A0A315ZG80_SEDFL|nr:FAD-dependent oxidoreductase [Sediminitomix flava]PWJ43754.1 D-amino-acid dehydrogenase [Sediminitomix flava]